MSADAMFWAVANLPLAFAVLWVMSQRKGS